MSGRDSSGGGEVGPAAASGTASATAPGTAAATAAGSAAAAAICDGPVTATGSVRDQIDTEHGFPAAAAGTASASASAISHGPRKLHATAMPLLVRRWTGEQSAPLSTCVRATAGATATSDARVTGDGCRAAAGRPPGDGWPIHFQRCPAPARARRRSVLRSRGMPPGRPNATEGRCLGISAPPLRLGPWPTPVSVSLTGSRDRVGLRRCLLPLPLPPSPLLFATQDPVRTRLR
jgi:hypothetical protein